MRGMFGYWGQQLSSIATTTDGTSNTIFVGETIPIQVVSNEFWHSIGGSAGTTVPLGFNSNTVPDSAALGLCCKDWGCNRVARNAPCRVTYALHE